MKSILTTKEQSLRYHNMIWVEGGTLCKDITEGEANLFDSILPPIIELNIPGFYIGQYLVTQFLWNEIMGYNPSTNKGDTHPVETIGWFDAIRFCNRLSFWSGREPCYYTDDHYTIAFGLCPDEKPELHDINIRRKKNARGYRLLKSSEWEWSARGGILSEGYKYSGSDKLKEVGWYEDNSEGETKEVGLKYPNELDLFDMSGNVWEWSEDYFDDNIRTSEAGQVYIDNNNKIRKWIIRGGSAMDDEWSCRIVYDLMIEFNEGDGGIGLRIALDAEQ